MILTKESTFLCWRKKEMEVDSEPAGKSLINIFHQFLMLFLAVFRGFLVEYKLEHQIEHQSEKEFIKSMPGVFKMIVKN